jgi:hypothetical protein
VSEVKGLELPDFVCCIKDKEMEQHLQQVVELLLARQPGGMKARQEEAAGNPGSCQCRTD